jgi:selenocysteine lyase/cysteine desulfurase
VPLDIEFLRAETPGCASVAHLDNAGASLPPAPVLDRVIDYLRAEATVGGYEIAEVRAAELESVYDRAAEMFGGAPMNWAFVESATRAWNAAFSALRFRPGDRVLTTRAEYPSNMGGLLRARELHGVEIEVIPDDDAGQVDVAALESMLDGRRRASTRGSR